MSHGSRATLVALAVAACAACAPPRTPPKATMKDRMYINPPAWAPPPGYSHAVGTRGGRLLFVSGQVPLDAAGQLVGGTDFTAQARQAFRNLHTVLTTAGASFDDVIKLTYFVVGLDGERVLALRAVRDEVLPPGHRPASSLLGVAALFRADVIIELEAVVELPPAP